jgi:hypothetical protein
MCYVAPEIIVDQSDQEALIPYQHRGSKLENPPGCLLMSRFRPTLFKKSSGQPLYSMAFPTLFHNGKADFFLPQLADCDSSTFIFPIIGIRGVEAIYDFQPMDMAAC